MLIKVPQLKDVAQEVEDTIVRIVKEAAKTDGLAAFAPNKTE